MSNDRLTDLYRGEEKGDKVDVRPVAILMVSMLAGVAIFASFLFIPGFLKSDREAQLVDIDYWESSGRIEIEVADESGNDEILMEENKIGVQLRRDGLSHTSVLFQGKESIDNEWYSSAIILVPFEEDLHAWQNNLADFRTRCAEYAAEEKRREEEKKRFRRILPPEPQ